MPNSTHLIELWHADKEMLKEKDFRGDPWRLAYNAFMCGFGRGLAVNKLAQPEMEVDFEKELDSLIIPKLKKYKALPSMMDVVKHFYELGLNARKEESK